jgi:hypothetical protein
MKHTVRLISFPTSCGGSVLGSVYHSQGMNETFSTCSTRLYCPCQKLKCHLSMLYALLDSKSSFVNRPAKQMDSRVTGSPQSAQCAVWLVVYGSHQPATLAVVASLELPADGCRGSREGNEPGR